MKTREIKIMLKDGSGLPSYATDRSSGCDVRCIEDFQLEPGERRLVHTGIFLQLPPDMEAQVRPRSGLALKHGVTVLNSPGTIDSDYQGECCVVLANFGNHLVEFKRGERIAQFVFVENIVQAQFTVTDHFTEVTERGDGGFGHSGTK